MATVSPVRRFVAPSGHNGGMPVRVDVQPGMLLWARERSGLSAEDLVRRFPKLTEWETGERLPTLKQLEQYAQATHTPVGFLFLTEPPVDAVPIPDYRTMGDSGVRRPSPDLLETIYLCQQRQEWYRGFAQVTQREAAAFLGTMTTTVPVEVAATAMRAALHFEIVERGPTWAEALRRLIEHAEDLGVLVMVSGVVGSNTHRKLDPKEFRGFALADDLAPVVFINGADTKAAQLFTLAHELAHLWLGQTALDDADLAASPTASTERWCNEVAAELLVPLADVRREFRREAADLSEELERLARHFKSSTLVVLRRLHDAGFFSWADYRSRYTDELARIMAILEEQAGPGGGDFYNTQPARVSKRFARAVIVSTLEGQTLHRDAFRMLGFKKLAAFQEMASRLGVS